MTIYLAMSYYLLRHVSDPKIIGVKNGGSQVEIDENGFKDKEKYTRLLEFFDSFSYWQKKSFTPDFSYSIQCARLLKNAKLTDFLEFRPFLMACPYMVSDRVKTVFSKFRFSEHYYMPVDVYDANRLVAKYNLLYCPLLDYDIVDFPKSLFFTGNAFLRTKKIHSFNSREEHLRFLKSNALVGEEKIHLSKLFDKALDFFYPRFGGLYISERLKEAIIQERFTGIKVLEPSEPTIALE
jgi:hypothetical protein